MHNGSCARGVQVLLYSSGGSRGSMQAQAEQENLTYSSAFASAYEGVGSAGDMPVSSGFLLRGLEQESCVHLERLPPTPPAHV